MPPPAAPQKIGRYVIQSTIGKGAMGVIYLAHDPTIDRPVALKLVNTDLLEGKDREAVVHHSQRFLRALDLTEEILATDEHWLLGPWLEQAKAWASDDDEREILEWNARSILTIWSIDAAPSLHEYANRDWHGLLSGYYRPRWVRFLEALPGTISSGTEPEFSDWHTRGDAWSRQQELHTTTPSGDPHAVASRIAAEIAGDPV